MNHLQATGKSYGFLWGKSKSGMPAAKWHFDFVQETFGDPLVRGRRGVDAGSGCGYDTFIMAANNPETKITSLDLSDGVFKTRELTAGLKNVEIVKCSLLDMPLKGDTFDFAYSFGVLHHTADPARALSEIARILKKNAPVFVYLYEDHSDNIFKYAAVKIICAIRFFTIKMPSGAIYFLSWLLSPFVFLLFSLPAKVLRQFEATRLLAEKMPFNFGKGLFSLKGDLYDRFSAPIEFRFSKKDVYDLFASCGFRKIFVTKMADRAGWLAAGYKK